jgi:hypothetical protein
MTKLIDHSTSKEHFSLIVKNSAPMKQCTASRAQQYGKTPYDMDGYKRWKNYFPVENTK